MRNFFHLIPSYRAVVFPLRRDRDLDFPLWRLPSSLWTFSTFHKLKKNFCLFQVTLELNNRMITIIDSIWVLLCEMTWIDVFSMLDVSPFIFVPSYSKCFALGWWSGSFIEFLHIVVIGRWFLFGISQYRLGYWFFVSFAEGAGKRRFGGGYFRFDDISVVVFFGFEALILGEWVAMGCVSPGGGWLIPSWSIFR